VNDTIHPAVPEPGEDDSPPKALDERELVAVLKRVAARDHGADGLVSLRHFHEALRYVEPINDEVARILKRAIKSWPTDIQPDAREIRRLLAEPEPAGAIRLDDEVSALLRAVGRRSTQGLVRLRAHPLGLRQRAAWFHTIADAVAAAVPGQAGAGRELARHLALQLADATRTSAVHALLSGPLGSGTRQVARAVAQALAPAGYRLLEIEMSQIRCEEEAAEIDGSQPYWKGARPGKLTSAVHGHARTVVVLHDFDRALPAAQASVLPALRDGVLLDNHGLGELTDQQRREGAGRQPTRVDMHQAVVLVTTTTGHDIWLHPDMAELLDGRSADQRDARQSLMQAMRQGERTHRGRTVAVFDLGTLACLEQHLVLFRPLGWGGLLARARDAIAQACQRATQRLGLPVRVVDGSHEALALALLASHGGQVDLDRLTGPQAEAELFATLAETMFDAELDEPARDQPASAASGAQVELVMPGADQDVLFALLHPMGSEPQRHLQRRRLQLRFDTEVTPSPTGWSVAVVRPRLAQAKELADYSGDNALTAVVPDVSFADVAGHDKAKAYLREVIDLYARADELRQRGLELPRGAVLHGPPGTGKTLLARAMAAEAGMAFIATSGADLLNPERVKQVFALARKNTPAVLFIDEVDALGRRGSHSSLHDVAINRLLTAIQGFDQRSPVYILAATNRMHLLDPALTRAGRLDRHIHVGPLDRAGRAPLVSGLMDLLPAAQRGDEATREQLLSITHGLTGAELGQVSRELKLHALRQGPGEALQAADLLDAVNERKHGRKSDARRREALRLRVATHEAGHAVLHELWRPEVPIEQVTITPRGESEGFMAVNTEEARGGGGRTAEHLRHEIGVLLGGRLAETLHFGALEGPSAGASADLRNARTLAFLAVAHMGLDGDHMGLLSLRETDDEDRALMPESLKRKVWQRVQAWLADAEAMARAALQAHWPVVQALAGELLAADHVAGARVAELVNTFREQGVQHEAV